MLLQPAYKLTLGSKVVDTTDEPRASTVVDLMVSLDMETPADSFTLIMGQVGRWKPEREDAATIELGYADNGGFVQVMAGKVARVEPDLTTVRMWATATPRRCSAPSWTGLSKTGKRGKSYGTWRRGRR